MRVLAIRGENLASLAGTFEVDLSGDPLGRVGLFAITGATGSGKTTLLDALCLALYDTTPRLEGSGGPRIGSTETPSERRMADSDVRGVLRRGTGHGFAEVDFIGADGRRYRATWSVRRAHRKPDGALQPQEMHIVDLDGDPDRHLTRTKSETLAAIAGFVGLTFDQFRRSVLLAQGDFARFLHATSDERAGLLECMTGTEIYGDLSRAAFARAKTERESLRDIERRMEAHAVLEPEARASLQVQVDAARGAVERVRTRRDALRDLVRARDAVTAAESALAAAREDARVADEAKGRAADERRAVTELEAVRPFRGRAELLAVARERVARTEAALAAANSTATAADEALQSARGLLSDRRLHHVMALARQAAGSAEALRQVETELSATDNGIGTIESWLAEHRVDVELEAAWPACEDLFRRLVEGEDSLPELIAGVAAAEAAAAPLVDATERAEGRLAAAREAHRVARDALREAVPTESGDAVEDAVEEAERERDLLRQREAAATRWRAARDACARVTAALGSDNVRLGALREERAAIDERLAVAAATLVEAERSRTAVEAALGLEERRHLLVDGEPCPLCGALEHPFAADAPRADALDAVRAGEATARERHEAVIAERSEMQQEMAACAERIRGAEADVAKHGAEHAAALVDWRATFADDQAPREPAVQDDGALAAAEARLVALRRARTVAKTAASDETAARDVRDQAVEAATGALRAVEDATRALGDARCDVATTTEALGKRCGGHVRLEGETAQAWRERLAAVIADVRSRRDRLDEERVRRNGLAVACETARARSAQDAATVAEVGARYGVESAPSGAHGQDEPAPEVPYEELVRQAQEEAAAVVLRERSLREAESAAERAATRRDEAVQAASAARDEAEAAERDLREVIEEAGRDVDATLVLLATPEGDVAARRSALDALDAAERHATTVVLERSRAAQAARDAIPGAPTDDPQLAEAWQDDDSAKAVAAAVDGELGAAQETLEGLAGALRADDDARAAAEALGVELAERGSGADVWLRLRELIGSSDGQVFRRFAQGLTLDVLLHEANHQLRDLAPRYLLERVPGENLALQVVDRDLGDEIRSVRSLSGGESFLASLALALGLASMASQRAPVDSLFIDEGFGTLDPESLDIAIAALEALQASGRQVGVISHVPGLADQIGVQVRVEQDGAGRSVVRVRGPGREPGAGPRLGTARV